jgi:hypothetical protein
MQVAAIKKAKSIPTSLIYEELNGTPVYYRGYEAVLKKLVKQESIMGSSEIQAYIIMLIQDHLRGQLPKKYTILTGELGLHLGAGQNFAADISIYERSQFLSQGLSPKYTQKIPLAIVEVDTKANFSDFTEAEYFQLKTEKLLQYGVNQIVWFFTKSQKVMICKKGEKQWIISDWTENIEILDANFSLKSLLDEEGIDMENIKY